MAMPIDWPLSEALDRARSYLSLSRYGVTICADGACKGEEHCVELILMRVIEGLVLALDEKERAGGGG